MKKRRCHTRHAQYASPVDITARCTRGWNSRKALAADWIRFATCLNYAGRRAREMKLQKKTSRSQHVYLFVWSAFAMHLHGDNALKYCRARRNWTWNCTSRGNLGRWHSFLFPSSLFEPTNERDAAFCFFARRRSFHQHTRNVKRSKSTWTFHCCRFLSDGDK